MKTYFDIPYGEFPQQQAIDLYLPETENFPVFVYFHGGGLENGDRKHDTTLVEHLIARGIGVAMVEYRMYPAAAYPDFVRDSARSVAWVFKNIKNYGGSDRIYVGGSSAGGYLSMMLCFDKRWLAPYKITPEQIAGYVHDAGQPTCHFNVLRERGIDSRRVMIDDTAPLYHIGAAEKYAPMQFIVSDNDMPGRYEQTKLVLATLKHFGYDFDKIDLKEMHGRHCAYVNAKDEQGESVLGKIVGDFIEKTERK